MLKMDKNCKMSNKSRRKPLFKSGEGIKQNANFYPFSSSLVTEKIDYLQK